MTGTVTIAVPRQCRDYMIGVRNKYYAFMLSLYVGTILFFRFITHRGWHIDFAQIIFLVAGVFAWYRQIKRPWQYVIDQEHLTVIWRQMGGRFWNIFEIRWRRDAIIGVEETEWRGLPALRILRQTKRPERRPDWLIVYAHEDQDKVKTQVLPLIEEYRRQYRQQAWADRLRS